MASCPIRFVLSHRTAALIDKVMQISFMSNNNNNPLFILGYTIGIANLHHGPAPCTKIKRIYIQDKTNC